MDRRKFLCTGAFSLLAFKFGNRIFAQNTPETGEEKATGFSPVTCENIPAEKDDLKIRFLGTGAAGWKPGGKSRRMSSVLVEDKFLIDFTLSAEDMLPKDIHPTEIFYTHSHADHFQPDRALLAGIRRVYLSETWADIAATRFQEAAKQTGKPVPEIIPLKIGKAVTLHGVTLTPLPANHATGIEKEQTLIYLIEKGTTPEKLGVRLLYATDTGGIMGKASRLAGFDSHVNPGRALTAFIMESTMGINHDEDFRIFNHSSAKTVSRIVNMLIATKRYLPPQGQPAYLTHMARSLHDKLPQDELNASLPVPLRAAYDGLEVVFKAVK